MQGDWFKLKASLLRVNLAPCQAGWQTIQDPPPSLVYMRPHPPRLPGYNLGVRLGGGPTCDVYSAVETRTSRPWAIKVLRDAAAADPSHVQMLGREAQIGLAVQHPNLVRIVRTGMEHERPYHLIMERARGSSLREELNRKKWLDASQVGLIGLQVAEALEALHRVGFVHADVKPDNLHFEPGPWTTLLDLGFAHRPGDDQGLADTGFVFGTANYVAPELCDESDRDGLAADVFSLGVTLFELLTGALPYPNGDVEETMVLHRDARPDSLWKRPGRWPIGLAALVDSMMFREPERRPTAKAVAQELQSMFARSATHRQAA